MITTADLKAQTRRELADLAKNYGVQGWHGMKKDELVDAIKKVQRRLRRRAGSEKGTSSEKPARASRTRAAQAPRATRTSRASETKDSRVKPSGRKTASPKRPAKESAPKESTPKGPTLRAERRTNGRKVTKASADSKTRSTDSKTRTAGSDSNGKAGSERISPKTARIRAQIRKRQQSAMRHKDLSTGTLVGGSAVNNGAQRTRGTEPHRDRAVLLVRDSFWLQATWEITSASVRRAQSALAERWHTATPTLRVLSIGDVNNNGAEVVERDIPIHGGVNSWYIDVDDPPSRFRVKVGYVADGGEFYSLCRSNIVETPRPGECDRLDEHWRDIAEDYERIYSLSGGYDTDAGDLKEMFEERLHRTMPLRGEQGRTVADPALLRESNLPFEVDAELIVFGKTAPNASVSVAGRPVKLQPDGSFTVRMELPDRRQVLPVTAESRDGLKQRTTVVAVERNTKVMEPVENDEPF